VPKAELPGLCTRYLAPVAEAIGAASDRIELLALDIYVFDNTIGMAQLALDIPASVVEPKAFVDSFDLATTRAARTFIAQVAGPAVERLARHFAAAVLPGRNGGKLLTPPARFVAFDDVDFSGDYRWPEDKSALLWVNRTM